MNAQKRSLVFTALLVINLAGSTFADVLVLKDGTLVDGDVDSLLRGSNEAIRTPDGRSVSLSDAVATHLGVTAKELKAGIERSSFISGGVRIDLVEAFIFETGEDEKREQFLQINVNVTNRDGRRYLNIERPRFFSNNYRWRLKDDVANEVRESYGDRVGELKLLSSLDRIEPETKAAGAMLFEPPLPKTEYLVLDLAPQMFEFNERLAFMGGCFFVIPIERVSTPESRLLAATEAVERYERTAEQTDQTAAKKLLDQMERLNEKSASELYARWKLFSFQRSVLALEKTSKPIDWSEIIALKAASIEASDEKLRETLLRLRQRAALTITQRGAAMLETNLDSALRHYRIKRLLFAGEPVSAEFRVALIDKLTKRFRELCTHGETNSAISDYIALQILDTQALDGLIPELGRLPANSNSIGMKFKFVPSGTFTMGADVSQHPELTLSSEPNRYTPHRVTLTQPFELGIYEVTQEQYLRVMGNNPSAFEGPRNPVEMVNWDEAVDFCRKLSELPEEQSAGYAYRLPTEAEWEFACRAGTTTRYSFGDSESELGKYAWYNDNAKNTSHRVGGKENNPLGLYDMHGNVAEWCQDWLGDYPSGPLNDPSGHALHNRSAMRGGSWHNGGSECFSANRDGGETRGRRFDLGFRVLRLNRDGYPIATLKLSPKDIGPSHFDSKASGFMFRMPENGNVVSKGSFSVWTLPEQPKPRKDYMIVIRIKIPEETKLYRISDLSGKIEGSDYYIQHLPFDPKQKEMGARAELDGEVVRLQPTSRLRVIKNHVQIMIPVKGGENLVRDTIYVGSRMLNESQKLEIEF